MAGTTTTTPADPTPAPLGATVIGGGTEPTRKDTDKRKNNARGLLNIPAARKR